MAAVRNPLRPDVGFMLLRVARVAGQEPMVGVLINISCVHCVRQKGSPESSSAVVTDGGGRGVGDGGEVGGTEPAADHPDLLASGASGDGRRGDVGRPDRVSVGGGEGDGLLPLPEVGGAHAAVEPLLQVPDTRIEFGVGGPAQVGVGAGPHGLPWDRNDGTRLAHVGAEGVGQLDIEPSKKAVGDIVVRAPVRLCAEHNVCLRSRVGGPGGQLPPILKHIAVVGIRMVVDDARPSGPVEASHIARALCSMNATTK
mmetsp:Transcript_44585/g.79929  ORF Transcript_44585/g.79929 Transcript_44585/m.79929 type:complete len:256 (+) Transcript_44585:3873-4640(+)